VTLPYCTSIDVLLKILIVRWLVEESSPVSLYLFLDSRRRDDSACLPSPQLASEVPPPLRMRLCKLNVIIDGEKGKERL